MTVTSLSVEQKRNIAMLHCNKEFTVLELAALYQRSRRTIIRVLEENNCAPEIKQRTSKRKPTPLPTLPYPIPTKPTVWQRIWHSIRNRLPWGMSQ